MKTLALGKPMVRQFCARFPEFNSRGHPFSELLFKPKSKFKIIQIPILN